MSADIIRIGLLFSVSGSYRTIGRSMLNGALLAFEEINADPDFPFQLEVVTADPGGCNMRYAEAAGRMLSDERLVHIVGCYTSSSRIEVLPFFEKHDGLLWYPSHYEGFESSEHVVYTGAAPNQHIVPLAEWLLTHCGDSAFFIGSNYIWAWENNKIMREAVLASGGEVLAERYLPVGETEFSDLIDQIMTQRPSFVFNTLIGESAYAFFRQFREAAIAVGIDQPSDLPVASCSLAEPELVEIGRRAAAGHISSSVYFETVPGANNRQFLKRYQTSFPDAGPSCADVEASYVAMLLLARAIRAAGTAEMSAVRAAVADIAIDAPQGRVFVDPENRHCYLTPRIGVSNEDFGFDLIYQASGPIKPDPYLVWSEPRPAPYQQPQLRVVE
ncbi:MAG: transporter substrate-binding domain-containing protein [Geminicoccales bacterium]